MLDAETSAEIRRLYYAEHWKIGTIAATKGVHPDAVRRALSEPGVRGQNRATRAKITDAFLPLIRETLERYPRLRATRLYQMVCARGYRGSVVQLRRVVRTIRPSHIEAFTVLTALPGESAQADWAGFGRVTIGRAERRLSCFVMTLTPVPKRRSVRPSRAIVNSPVPESIGAMRRAANTALSVSPREQAPNANTTM